MKQRLGKIRDAQMQQSGRFQGGGGDFGQDVNVQDIERPPPSAQWQCGKARLKLRQQFNRNEIDVAKVIRQYDTNQDWKLERDEFLVLLQDYNRWFQHITKEEVEMVLMMADLDHDECIEPNEVLYALRVWYAYVNMPRAVGPVLASLSDATMPSPETIREALLLLNEEHPVAAEEADYVRHIALALGATEQRVNAKQMRMAISAWYLHIERKETAHNDLVKHAVAGAHDKICANNPVQNCCRGHCDPVTLALMGMFSVIWILLPTAAIWIGGTTDTGRVPCERPALSFTVWATGWLAIIQAAAGLWLTAAWECTAMNSCRMVAAGLFAILTVVLMVFWIMGLWQIMTTNPSRCGFVIWEFGNLLWVFVPILSGIFLCCGLPVIYCTEYFHNKRIDAGLMDRNESGSE